MTRPIRETFLAFARAMNKSGVAYAVVGGFAVSSWGVPRTTQDVDAIARLKGADLDALRACLTTEGLEVSMEDLEDAVREGSHVTIHDPGAVHHVDLAPAKDPAAAETLRYVREVVISGVAVRVASPEDTIANKIRYGSHQDLRDAEAILVRQGPKLDRARLEATCAALGVGKTLRALLARIEDT